MWMSDDGDTGIVTTNFPENSISALENICDKQQL